MRLKNGDHLPKKDDSALPVFACVPEEEAVRDYSELEAGDCLVLWPKMGVSMGAQSR